MPEWIKLGLVLNDGSVDYSVTSYTTKIIGLKSLKSEGVLNITLEDLYQWFQVKDFFECDECRRKSDGSDLCEDCLSRRTEYSRDKKACRLPRLCKASQSVERHLRAETGPRAFGEDWPGVFIRGDNAMGYAISLRKLLSADLGDALYLDRAVLKGLLSTLEGARVSYFR